MTIRPSGRKILKRVYELEFVLNFSLCSQKELSKQHSEGMFKYFVRRDEILILWFSSTLEEAVITACPLWYLWAGREILGS